MFSASDGVSRKASGEESIGTADWWLDEVLMLIGTAACPQQQKQRFQKSLAAKFDATSQVEHDLKEFKTNSIVMSESSFYRHCVVQWGMGLLPLRLTMVKQQVQR
jgi:hypothetical protein